MRATELLKAEHTAVRQLLTELRALAPREGDARQALVDKTAGELDIHAQIEEEIFYPAIRRVSGRIDEAHAQHDEINRLLDDLAGRLPSTEHWADTLADLVRAVERHVADEEAHVFQDAERLGPDALERLGRAMQARRASLRSSLLQRALRALRQLGRKTGVSEPRPGFSRQAGVAGAT